jgi:hypothetical protein
VAINTRKYIEEYLKIRTKSAEVKPLILNKPQERLYNLIAEQHKARACNNP